MGVGEFDALTPAEFGDILTQWRKEQNRKEAAWLAGIRLHAAISIQPHCKHTINPKQLFAIPEIDQEHEEAYEAPKLTPEQRREQYEQLKKASGFK